MSELKVYVKPLKTNILGQTIVGQSYYLKSEADKVIAHHKYKRCLAMARWCESEEKRLEAIAPIFDTDKECWEYGEDHWYKWHKRWRELAEKFKEE